MATIRRFVLKAAIELVALLVQLFMNLKDRFNPLLYSDKRRVIRIIDGISSFRSGRAAVFVVYRKEGIPFYIRNVLVLLRKYEVDCWVSVNHGASEEIIDFLVKNAHKVIVRKNFGRDFCAYKDTISRINLDEFQRLLILNDSLFYFSKNLTSLFKRLFESKQELVALACSYEKHWHAQSYLISLSRNIFLSNSFNLFWKSYVPYNSRRHAINGGELKFSRDVLSRYAEVSPAIYNRLVASSLTRDDQGDYFRFLVPDHLKFKRNGKPTEFGSAHVLRAIEDFNPSHGIALLCSNTLGFCVLKRDISFRGTFSLSSVASALNVLGVDSLEIEEAINELEVKGKVRSLGLFARIQEALGFL